VFFTNSAKLRMSEQKQPPAKTPSLFRNYLSFAGTVIVIAAVVSILLLFSIELTQTADNPYLGIITYIILPSFLAFGLLVILTGMLLERRRRRRSPTSEIPPYPKIDLNDARQRHVAIAVIGLAFIFVCASAFGSYRAYEYTESVEFCGQTCHTVMKPEAVAFAATSHARIRCVDCHVGHGAESYARSKLSGAPTHGFSCRQLLAPDCHAGAQHASGQSNVRAMSLAHKVLRRAAQDVQSLRLRRAKLVTTNANVD
jgi:NapC/NirT cytochrome c family, N-terminal region